MRTRRTDPSTTWCPISIRGTTTTCSVQIDKHFMLFHLQLYDTPDFCSRAQETWNAFEHLPTMHCTGAPCVLYSEIVQAAHFYQDSAQKSNDTRTTNQVAPIFDDRVDSKYPFRAIYVVHPCLGNDLGAGLVGHPGHSSILRSRSYDIHRWERWSVREAGPLEMTRHKDGKEAHR